MNRTEAMTWVLSLCQDTLRKSQAKTLSVLVAATLGAMRLSLANIGRELAAGSGGAAKHAIKRVDRFLGNERVEPVEVMLGAMNHLWRRKLKWHARKPDRRPLLVSFDWTKVRGFHVLMAAIVVEGRALPLCWASYKEKVQGRSQNALEEAMLLRIAAALPDGIRVVILADRGFGRAELIRTCQRLKLEYLIRVRGDVQVLLEGSRYYRGLLKHYAIRRGQCHSYRDVLYRGEKPVRTNLILRWTRGLPKDRDVPWYLATSLPVGRGRARSLSALYRLRFDIEELFRDAKNENRGWSLAKTQVKRADRLDRLILLLALAYVLLVAVGLWCRKHLDPRLWCTNRRQRELSAFAIGRTMLDRVDRSIHELIDLLLRSLATPEENWG
jgi:hypothetical protein